MIRRSKMKTYKDFIIYKGQDKEVHIPFAVSGFTDFNASFYTDKQYEVLKGADDFDFDGEWASIFFDNTDLDLLADGVLRYTFTYKLDDVDVVKNTNSAYILKTPENYSAHTADEVYQEGVDDQKAKLSSITIVENGTYEAEDGYSAVTVNVSGGSSVDIISTAMTVTGDVQTIESETGKAFSAVTVDATQWGNDNYGAGYASGFTDGMVSGTSIGYDEGVAEQKAKLSSVTIVENGTYESEDGYSAVTVNISGSPSVDIISTDITMTWEKQKTIESEAGTAWSAVTVYSSPTWRPYENNLYRYAKQMCYANDLEGYSFSGTYLCHVNNNQNFAAVDIGPDGEITGYTGWGMEKIENDHYYKKDDMGYTFEAWVERRHTRKFLYWLTNADISELDIYGTGHGLEMFGFPLPLY